MPIFCVGATKRATKKEALPNMPKWRTIWIVLQTSEWPPCDVFATPDDWQCSCATALLIFNYPTMKACMTIICFLHLSVASPARKQIRPCIDYKIYKTYAVRSRERKRDKKEVPQLKTKLKAARRWRVIVLSSCVLPSTKSNNCKQRLTNTDSLQNTCLAEMLHRAIRYRQRTFLMQTATTGCNGQNGASQP